MDDLQNYKENKEEAERRYKIALELYRLDSEAHWNFFNIFFLVNALLAGFLVNVISKNLKEPIFITVIAFLGLTLCVLWMMGHFRASQTCSFRMKQAQEAEPEGWEIVGGKAEEFFENREVIIKGRKERMRFIGRTKNQYYRSLIIVGFVFQYLAIFFLSNYQLCSRS